MELKLNEGSFNLVILIFFFFFFYRLGIKFNLIIFILKKNTWKKNT